jgi:hypothetical protein
MKKKDSSNRDKLVGGIATTSKEKPGEKGVESHIGQRHPDIN